MLNKQMPEYIKHHRLAHHQLQVFQKLTVERNIEIMSEHWHAAQIGILVACAYFKNKEGAYYEQTVYVMTDGKEQSAAITQAAVNQVVCYLLAEHDMDMRQLYMWSDGCAGQFKGAPAMRQHWDSVMQLCTLGKKLSVKMLNEYCKAVGLCVPVGTLQADLRYMVLQHLNEQAECD
ncbi:hypothetical protein QJQ45_005403 [Haematococcus lacustris]|nr:hypothetical protein QJQ45_005403 [Haematococcus lacustris]